jgi:two-component system OmpR family response regulator
MPVRVLVVDDEPALLTLLRLVLEDEGYEVATAANGREALERAAAFAPDVALLDVEMPVMDGAAFAAADREVAHPPPAPIIVVTAVGQAAERAAQLRAAGFLGKPFELDELSTRMAAAVADQG